MFFLCMFSKQVFTLYTHHSIPLCSVQKVFGMERLEMESTHIQIHSVYVAQLTVDML